MSWAGVDIVDLVNFLSDGEAPEIPECVPCDGREFIETCFSREHEKRGNASDLLLHPFLCPEKEKTKKIVVSPIKEKKTLLVKLKIKRTSKPLKFKRSPSMRPQLKKLLRVTKMNHTKSLDSSLVSLSGDLCLV